MCRLGLNSSSHICLNLNLHQITLKMQELPSFFMTICPWSSLSSVITLLSVQIIIITQSDGTDQSVTMTPCFFSSSMAFLILRQLILLLERLMIRRELILLRAASKAGTASSVSRLKERLMLVTRGINQMILVSPSLVSLFLTSFSPFTFFTGRRYANTQKIQLSFSPQPVRSKVSRFSFQQNSSMSALTVLRSGETTSLIGLLSEFVIFSLDLLFLLTAGETDSLLKIGGSRVEVRCEAANSIFCSFSLKALGDRRTSCCTQGNPSMGSLLSKTTLMKLKTELHTPAFSTTRICEIRASMVATLLFILASNLDRSVSPSLHISRGPPQQMATWSSSVGVRSAFWKSQLHLASHCLYLRCESFSSLISVVILPQIALKFLATSSYAFFYAIRTFSAISQNFLLIYPTKRSFSAVILRTTPSLNSLLLNLCYSSIFLLRYP